MPCGDAGWRGTELRGPTLPDVEDVFFRFSTQAQIGLVDATNEPDGRIDPGRVYRPGFGLHYMHP